jgi:hypothetical protein
VIGFVNPGSADASAGRVADFRKGLGETGYVEGRNVTVEYTICGAFMVLAPCPVHLRSLPSGARQSERP